MEKKFYTLQEVTGLLGGIAPKTLREWMQRLGMQAVQDKRDPRRWLLSWQQIEHLAAAHGRIVGAENAPAADPLAALEARLMAEIRRLEREIKRLEQRVADNEQPTIKIPAVRAPEPPQTASPAPHSYPHLQSRRGPPLALQAMHALVNAHFAPQLRAEPERIGRARLEPEPNISQATLAAVLLPLWQPLRGFHRCQDKGCPCWKMLPS